MTLRSAHGNARRLGRLVVSECCPADELPPATPAETARPQRTPDGRFAKGNTVAQHARTKAGPSGALASLDAQADPAWQAARRWAKRACTQRVRELAKLHGGELSSEVCALVIDSWELRGDARYLAARARAENSPELSRAAATLLASARQAQRDAWELAAREAAARPRRSALEALRLAAPDGKEGR